MREVLAFLVKRDFIFYLCGINGCEYKAKRADNVVHDLDASYHICGVGKCEYKAKTAALVRKHRGRMHGIV